MTLTFDSSRSIEMKISSRANRTEENIQSGVSISYCDQYEQLPLSQRGILICRVCPQFLTIEDDFGRKTSDFGASAHGYSLFILHFSLNFVHPHRNLILFDGYRKKKPVDESTGLEIKPRQLPTLPQANLAVPSATRPLTSVFGMGTGVTSALWPPGKN